MSEFAQLMALSAAQTRQSQNAVQSALLERQRREQERRKQQEEKERKELEQEKKLRLMRMERERLEQEKRQKMEEELKAREATRLRREEAQRDALLHGPKKSKSDIQSKHSHDSYGKRRAQSVDADSDSVKHKSTDSLTREELRERKHQAEQRRLYMGPKRSSTTNPRRPGRSLPGGAVNIETTSRLPPVNLEKMSVRERFAAMPNTLTKLNVVKRDTRTIDEIVQDRAKSKEGKVLDGDAARGYNDWFTNTRKAIKPRPASAAPASGSSTPRGSQSATPVPSGTSPAKKSTTNGTPHKSSVSPTKSSGLPDKLPSRPKASSSVTGRPPARVSSSLKRSRSLSHSESPPPKRRAVVESEDLSSMIWGIFGKKRADYVDIISDEEDDMEVDSRAVEREEQYSARLAAKEDAEALAAEKRHEEEKKRKKLARERLG